MLPKDLKWYFPESLEETEELLKLPGVILHAGGTRILKTQPKTISGLIDISGLELDYIHLQDGVFSIGAATTFNEIVTFSRRHKKLVLLAKSLSSAASTPLRNRITIGGSLKDFPLWSSLYAPLIALDAKIEISLNDNLYIMKVEEYISSEIHKGKHLITRILIEDNRYVRGGVKKFTLIRFEYPLFNIAVTFLINKKIVEEAHIVITGVKSRFKRFKSAESVFIGKELSLDLIEKSAKHFNPKFVSDYKYSEEYKENVARVYFKDILNDLCGGKI